jgi:hypothetical protein
MGKRGRISCAQYAGAGLVLASVAGLLGFGVNFAIKSMKNVSHRILLNTPGLGASLRDSTIVVLLFSAITAVVLLLLLVLSACGAKGGCVNGLWFTSLVLFIPVLVGGVLVIERTKYGDYMAEVFKMQDRTLEDNDAVKAYVEAFEAYDLARAAATKRVKRISLGKVGVLLNRSIDAETTLSKEQLWSYCSTWSGEELNDLKAKLEGEIDKEFWSPTFTYYYHSENKKVPLESDDTRETWLRDYPTIPDPEEFYDSKSVPACYGLKVDEDSVTEAIEAKDPCKIVLTAKDCAPGWTVELLAEYEFCWSFTNCKESLPKALKVWEETLKAEKQENPLRPPLPLWYKLPKGWNELEALKDYTKDNFAARSAEEEALSLTVYHALTFTLLSIGAVGFIFILTGTIVTCTVGKGKGDDIEP